MGSVRIANFIGINKIMSGRSFRRAVYLELRETVKH